MSFSLILNHLKIKQFWLRNHLNFAGVFLSGFALCCSFSISLTQFFLGLSLLGFLIDFFFWLSLKRSNPSSLIEKNFVEHFAGYKNHSSTSRSSSLSKQRLYRAKLRCGKHEILTYLAAWIILRLVHLFISPEPLEEFKGLKEIWLLSILPLVMYRLPNSKWFNIFWISLVTGAASTGAYNLFKYPQLDLKLEHFRVGGFFDTMHTLSYTGITGLLIFICLGGALFFWQKEQRKISIYLMAGNIFILIGFILSYSKGGYIALAISLAIFLIFVLRKKFIFVLPIFLIFLGLTYKNLPGVADRFAFAKEDFFHQIKNNINCGSILDRINFLSTGMAIWGEHPVFGTGVGGYPEAYQKHRPKDVCGVAAQPDIHLHNDFLNTLALYGSVGFAIFMMFYLLPFLQTFKKVSHESSLGDTQKKAAKERDWLSVGALASISMMFFMGLTQCHFTDEEVQMVFWLVLGIFYREMK